MKGGVREGSSQLEAQVAPAPKAHLFLCYVPLVLCSDLDSR